MNYIRINLKFKKNHKNSEEKGIYLTIMIRKPTNSELKNAIIIRMFAKLKINS